VHKEDGQIPWRHADYEKCMCVYVWMLRDLKLSPMSRSPGTSVSQGEWQ
jgi:hypothetical protein